MNRLKSSVESNSKVFLGHILSQRGFHGLILDTYGLGTLLKTFIQEQKSLQILEIEVSKGGLGIYRHETNIKNDLFRKLKTFTVAYEKNKMDIQLQFMPTLSEYLYLISESLFYPALLFGFFFAFICTKKSKFLFSQRNLIKSPIKLHTIYAHL